MMKNRLFLGDCDLRQWSYIKVRCIDGGVKELSMKCTYKTPVSIRVALRWDVR
jgi:hypothetical protein